jgi:hypothetical protein
MAVTHSRRKTESAATVVSKRSRDFDLKHFRLCTTICKNVRSARVSGNAHFGLVQPPTTTFAPKWAEFRIRCGNDAR